MTAARVREGFKGVSVAVVRASRTSGFGEMMLQLPGTNSWVPLWGLQPLTQPCISGGCESQSKQDLETFGVV